MTSEFQGVGHDVISRREVLTQHLCSSARQFLIYSAVLLVSYSASVSVFVPVAWLVVRLSVINISQKRQVQFS